MIEDLLAYAKTQYESGRIGWTTYQAYTIELALIVLRSN